MHRPLLPAPSPLLALAVLAAWLGAFAYPLLAGENAESPPGRQASGRCAGAEVTFDILDLASQAETLTTGGSWKVGGTADGVLLEVRVNSNRFHAELQRGAAGRYAYETDFRSCGLQVVRVFASPTVREGDREVECLTRGHSVAKKLDVDCTPSAKILRCTWECADDRSAGCAGTCTGAAEGGEPTLVGLWGVNDADYATVAGPAYGPWTAVVRCKPGEKVTFRVRDHAGTGEVSPVAEKPCGAD